MATQKSWKQLVKINDPEHDKEPDAYVFNKGKRKFKSKKDPYK